MIKLKNILVEVINTYQIEAALISDRSTSITSILDQIRGLEKVTIVNNITPEDYPQKQDVEYTKLKIKFVTREEAKQDLLQFKEDILTSDRSENDLRIPGVKTVKFRDETLRRL